MRNVSRQAKLSSPQTKRTNNSIEKGKKQIKRKPNKEKCQQLRDRQQSAPIPCNRFYSSSKQK